MWSRRYSGSDEGLFFYFSFFLSISRLRPIFFYLFHRQSLSIYLSPFPLLSSRLLHADRAVEERVVSESGTPKRKPLLNLVGPFLKAPFLAGLSRTYRGAHLTQ